MALTQAKLEYQREYRERTDYAASKKYTSSAKGKAAIKKYFSSAKGQAILQASMQAKRDQTLEKPGIIYAVGTGDLDHPVKIGWTGLDMKTRLAGLQSGSPTELKVLFTSKPLSNANKVEYDLLEGLKNSGKHIRGEWFNLNQNQLDMLKILLA